MLEVNGKFNTAIVYSNELDDVSVSLIRCVCDQEAFRDSKIRIMSDVHAGKGCCIGTTMTIKDKVVPSMVGVDIGCGMEVIKLGERTADWAKLDDLIRRKIPSGMCVRDDYHPYNDLIDLETLRCFRRIRYEYARHSLGTLGGGNHFIEIDKDGEGYLYLVIHSGSRHLGTEVAGYYQEEGMKYLLGCTKSQLDELILKLKSEGRESEIQDTIKALKVKNPKSLPVPEELVYVSGSLMEDYLYDMMVTQRFAMLNRRAIADVIVRGMGFSVKDEFETVHNYIDTESMILRKGAVSAKNGERLLIPINMRDGSLICIGKGNEAWNFSAPHGAGRVMSRNKAIRELDINKYRKEMEGIYTTCVKIETIDESPFVYKPLENILGNIKETVDVEKRIIPVFNFKADGEGR